MILEYNIVPLSDQRSSTIACHLSQHAFTEKVQSLADGRAALSTVQVNG